MVLNFSKHDFDKAVIIVVVLRNKPVVHLSHCDKGVGILMSSDYHLDQLIALSLHCSHLHVMITESINHLADGG